MGIGEALHIRYSYGGTIFELTFLKGKEFHMSLGRPLQQQTTQCVIFSLKRPIVLVPPLSSMAAVSKAFTPLPWKNNRRALALGVCCHQPHTLRFCKCPYGGEGHSPIEIIFTNYARTVHSSEPSCSAVLKRLASFRVCLQSLPAECVYS